MDQYLEIYTPVAELANRIDLGNTIRLTLNPTTELNSFKQMLQSIDIPPVELSNLVLDGTIGNYRLTLDGRAVDIVRGVEDLRYNANLLNFLTRLGLTQTTTAQAKEAEIKTQYTQNAIGFHQIMRMKNRSRIAKEITGRYGKNPRNEQELEAILNRDANLKGIFEAFLHKLKSSYVVDPNAKPYGDWVRKHYRLSTYDLPTLFNTINRHKLSLGGCWAVRADGYKCLVASLSCNPSREQRQYRCSPNNRCGPDKQQPCYGCLKWNANNTCAEAPPCENRREGCSKACSNRKIEVPSDAVLICIKRTFWVAAQDYMNQNFTMVPGPAPLAPPGGAVVTDDTDEPDDEDANELPYDEDEPITDEELPAERPLSATIAEFFGSTWVIWVIGFVIIEIIFYRGMRRY
jgi:hypothetical protein